MSAARRAWTLSLTLHAVAFTGLVALATRTPPAAVPVAIDTRATADMAVGLVLLDSPAPRPPSPPRVPQPLPPAPPTPPAPAPPPTAPSSVQPVAHAEVSPWPSAPTRPAVPVIEGPVPPVAMAPPAPARPAVELPPGAATTFFGVPALGRSVVFVIDRSSSMGMAGRLDRAKREVVVSLGQLSPSAKFQVIAYHRAAEPLRVRGQSGLLPATPDMVAEAVAAVEGLAAEGGTNHLQALQRALALQPDVIYFLTDEDDLKSGEVSQVTQFNRGKVCVHALCLVPPMLGRETPMQALARGNRGVFRVVAR
jgi:hypothetical protein